MDRIQEIFQKREKVFLYKMTNNIKIRNKGMKQFKKDFRFLVCVNGTIFWGVCFVMVLFLSRQGYGQVIQISSIEDLQKIGNEAGYPLNGQYELAQDIDASDTVNWNGGAGFNPIGNYDYPFVGKFDGKEYKITGLYINRPTNNDIGLFGYVGSGG